jgi:phosphoglycerate kinase
MRVDFNVPLENGKVANDKRIKAALPTIEYIVKNGGKLILMSHLGRPKGQRVPEMSLKPCVAVLSELLGKDVAFVDDCIGATVESAVGKLQEGDVLLLENLRYYKEETDNKTGRFRRSLCKRCLWHRSPGPCFHRRRDPLF